MLITLGLATTLILGVATVASLIPTQVSMGIDPGIALRGDG